MSAPNSRVRAMGIFHAPVDLPKDVFHSKAEAIADAVLALPVSQRNLLKYELVRCAFEGEACNSEPSRWMMLVDNSQR